MPPWLAFQPKSSASARHIHRQSITRTGYTPTSSRRCRPVQLCRLANSWPRLTDARSHLARAPLHVQEVSAGVQERRHVASVWESRLRIDCSRCIHLSVDLLLESAIGAAEFQFRFDQTVVVGSR